MILRHIQAKILQQSGGRHNWTLLEEVVKAMTPEQQQAYYRTLEHAEEEGRRQGKRDAMKSPFRFTG